jgi:prepilin-type N-terminal cleavage/methylation domain-containing protein
MRRSRQGFTLIESCAAAAILAAALSVAVGLLTSVARQRQGASRHAQAVIVADNLLERLTSEPYEALTAERADEVRRQSEIAGLLPNGEVQIRLGEASGSPPAKRIEVDVIWRTTGTGSPSHHNVATWVYGREANR